MKLQGSLEGKVLKTKILTIYKREEFTQGHLGKQNKEFLQVKERLNKNSSNWSR